jgi:type IV secretion system protein VirD4
MVFPMGNCTSSGNFGTARFATWADLLRAGMIGQGDGGWCMGRAGYVARPTLGEAIRGLCNPSVGSEAAVQHLLAALGGSRFGGDDFIRIHDGVHGAVFAPAGAGKTTKLLANNLFSNPANMVCVDPKGELYDLTAEHRRDKFGHTIIRLDPANHCGPGGNCFNPLDFIKSNEHNFIDRCRDLANQLCVRSGKETEPFWVDSAETVIASMYAYVCANESNPQLRSLRGMRRWIASRQDFSDALANMQKSEDQYAVLQQLGHQLAWHVDRQLAGVMGHAQKHTDIFDSPLIVDATCSTDWTPQELRSKPLTVYAIVPGDLLVVWSGWLRVVLGSLLRIITRGKPTEKNPVLFLVDECAHLGGHMQALQDGITLMRGMGIRIFLCFQSLNQVNLCFGDHASTVLDNLGTQIYFGLNSDETCEALSKRIGDYTLSNVTYGDNSGYSLNSGIRSSGDSRNWGSNASTTELAVRLIKPDEIRRLGGSAGLLFHKWHHPVMVQMTEYFADPAFRWRPWRGWGTGRSKGLGLSGLVLALVALAVSCLVTALVASLPPPGQSRPGAAAPGGFDQYGPVQPWRQPAFQPSPYEPATAKAGGPGQAGWRPLPPDHVRGRLYRRQRRSYSY